ncbi:MAG TPA: hypothetical protein VF610_01320, partial [Segetibacter sp.]
LRKDNVTPKDTPAIADDNTASRCQASPKDDRDSNEELHINTGLADIISSTLREVDNEANHSNKGKKKRKNLRRM